MPYQKEFGWHAVWSHQFIYPSFRDDMDPVIQLVRDQVRRRLRLPLEGGGPEADMESASREILEGLEGEALEEMRAGQRET